MKTVKVTKKMLKLHPQDLLIKLGAANVEKRRAYPQHVYFSKADYKELRANVQKMAKKEYPYSSKKGLDYAVGMTLLDLGPNETLAEAIKPGYAVVDFDSIKAETENGA